MARPITVHIDPTELEKLCAMHCTHEEIAGWFGCSFRTIEERRRDTARLYTVPVRDKNGNPTGATEEMNFYDIMERGYARGRISIRRHQIRILESSGPGSATMAVWLGKQILGQRDNFDVIASVDDVQGKPDESNRDDLRRRILGLAAKLGTGTDTQRPN